MTIELRYYAKENELITDNYLARLNNIEYFALFNTAKPVSMKVRGKDLIAHLGNVVGEITSTLTYDLTLVNYEDITNNIRRLTDDEEKVFLTAFFKHK
jgi:hypothetical protein